jgi:hypothetical protein
LDVLGRWFVPRLYGWVCDDPSLCVSHHQQTTVRLKLEPHTNAASLAPAQFAAAKVHVVAVTHQPVTPPAPAGFLRGSNRFLGRTLSHHRDPAPAAGSSRCGECDVSHRRCLPGVAQEGPSRGIILYSSTPLLSPGEV